MGGFVLINLITINAKLDTKTIAIKFKSNLNDNTLFISNDILTTGIVDVNPSNSIFGIIDTYEGLKLILKRPLV